MSIPFALCCFHFTIKGQPDVQVTPDWYIGALEEAIKSVPNIGKVEIRGEGLLAGLRLNSTKSLGAMKEAEAFLPRSAIGLEVDFEIHIPSRVQENHDPLPGRPIVCGEDFLVSLRFGYFFPFTMVRPSSPTGDCRPSSAVPAIRRFLEGHFEQNPSKYLQFDFQGPSPFHADFYLRAPKDEDHVEQIAPYVFSISKRRGYDGIQVLYDPEFFDDDEAAYSGFPEYLGDEFSLFYRQNFIRHRILKDWSRLDDKLDSLVDAFDASGIRRYYNILFRTSPLIREIAVDLTKIRSGPLLDRHSSQRNLSRLRDRQYPPMIEPYIADILEDEPEFPAQDIRELLTLFEGRRTKVVESAIVLVASLLGGAVGALITLILSR